MKLQETFEVHDTLNPKLFDTTSMKMLDNVVSKLLEIVDVFKRSLEIPLEIADIQAVGSNASYNYTDTSDLDLHIIANFDLVSDEPELLKIAYDSYKSSFNSKYDITIKGIDVELYVQDIKAGITSNGIYSVLKNEWVKIPERIDNVQQYDTTQEVTDWKNRINSILTSGTYSDAVDAINDLYLLRHNGIATGGEYSKDNQIFKEIRSSGDLQRLKDFAIEHISRNLSLEGFSSGYIINRLED